MKKLFFKNTKKGLITFISIFLFSLIVLYIVFNIQSNNISNKIEDVIKSDMESYALTINNEITNISKDVFLLEDLTLTKEYLVLNGDSTEFASEELRTELENNFISIINNRNVYDQIRILDNTGQEIIRINYDDELSYSVEDSLLQNKASRYYFSHSIILDDNNLYISELDLNIENGEIEYIDGEPKSMLRLATPIFNDNGDKLGIIVVNYLANSLFDSPNDYYNLDYTHLEVINENGYYIHSSDTNKEFGFMFDDKQDEVVSKYLEYDILSNYSDSIMQERVSNILYSSLSVSDTLLSNSITSSINKKIVVVSESTDLIIFAKVDCFNTPDIYSLLKIYIVLSVILLTVSFSIAKFVDEIDYFRKEQLKTVVFNSTHDALTGLPNRSYIFNDIKYKLSRNNIISVLFLDFDGFKKINDNYGHNIGDLALIEGSKRLKDCVRQNDEVSRIGGDEFLIVLNNLSDKKIITKICKEIIKSFSQDFIFGNITCNMGISIGIERSNDSINVEDLINNADKAMYSIKQLSKNSFRFYDEIE